MLEDGRRRERYVTKRGISKSCLGVTVYPTSQAADEARDKLVETANSYDDYYIGELYNREIEAIKIHRLRLRASRDFDLRRSTPLVIIADRYEEEGLVEEANFLRSRNGAKT